MINLAAGVLGQVIGLFGAKGKAAQEQLKARVSMMERSWTDEFIAVVWFSPVIVAWFSPAKSEAWITALTVNQDYFGLLVGITAAVFGLGKLNGRK